MFALLTTGIASIIVNRIIPLAIKNAQLKVEDMPKISLGNLVLCFYWRSERFIAFCKAGLEPKNSLYCRLCRCHF